MHAVGEGPLARCPKCGSPVRRLVPSRMGIAFHGSGFYATDHRSEEYKREARKDGEPGTSAS
ncbi:MAG TPA: FmdB family transcriptional regulator [Bacillota bacterium]|nr:FmdB family transcriptional regulator [Bacillota bacterium]